MKVRTVAEIESTAKLLEDLELLSLKQELSGFSPTQLVAAARTNDSTQLNRVGSKKFKMLIDALDKAGFIRHESSKTEYVREMLWTIFRGRTRKERLVLENNTAYELREEATEQDLQMINECLKQFDTVFIVCNGDKTLTVRKSIEESFGLSGEKPRNRSEIAGRYQTTNQRIQQAQLKAFNNLASPENPSHDDLRKMLAKVSGIAIQDLF